MSTKKEYRKAYKAWRKLGIKQSRVLLDIWRSLVPDSKHMTYGTDPKKVWEEYVCARVWAARDIEVRYDENTLFKVVAALTMAGLSDEQASDAINRMQNAGILFRERV